MIRDGVPFMLRDTISRRSRSLDRLTPTEARLHLLTTRVLLDYSRYEMLVQEDEIDVLEECAVAE